MTVTPQTGAPAGALSAGFTTLALNSDFTSTFYGTLSNWLDCAGATNPVWYNTDYGVGPAPCSDYSVITDPVYGGQVLSVKYTLTDLANGIQNANINSTQGHQDSPGITFPTGMYYEISMRLSTDTKNSCQSGQFCEFFDTFKYTHIGNPNPFIEWDFVEMYSDGSAAMVGGPDVNGASGNPGAPPTQPININGFDYTVPHIYGARVMHDGVATYSRCDYLDNVQLSCTSTTSAAPSSILAFRELMIGAVIGMNNDPPGTPGKNPTKDRTAYISRIRVWACPGWASSSCVSTVPVLPPPNP